MASSFSSNITPSPLAKETQSVLKILFPGESPPRPPLGVQMRAYTRYQQLLLNGVRSIVENDLTSGFTLDGRCLSAKEEDSLPVQIEAAFSAVRRAIVRPGQSPWTIRLIVHGVRIIVRADAIEIRGEFTRF